MHIHLVKFFAKGKRGELFTGKYKGVKVVIKRKSKSSEAVGRISNEYNWLKKLNKKGIGPKVIGFFDGKLVYRYVDGVFLPEFVVNSVKRDIKKLLKDVFVQCFEMDRMNVDKEEMHNPYKHIVVTTRKKVVLLDFERCHFVRKCKNVTQFCQYLISAKFGGMLKKKGFKIDRRKMISAAKKYKREMDKKSFDCILKLVC